MAESDNRQHNIDVLESLQEGDLIEFKRDLGYSHWGVYAGNETVIHLTLDDSVSGFAREVWNGRMLSAFDALSNIFVVKRDNFFDVAKGCPAEKNNQTDEILSPYWPDRIVQNAIHKIGRHGYNILTQNCEHFAKYCRYGKAISDQVEVVCKGMTSITEVKSIKRHNLAVLEGLQMGDLVQFKRGVYLHWAVYTGDKKVIHLLGDENETSCVNVITEFCGIRKAELQNVFIREDNIWVVANGCKFYKNNYRNGNMRPFPAGEIVQRARAEIGVFYNPRLWRNCEHFATFCRYGKS